MTEKCMLCKGSGENRTEIEMKVNNELCPRCGGYGTVPNQDDNTRQVNEQDMEYIKCNHGQCVTY